MTASTGEMPDGLLAVAQNPDDDEAFLRQLRERAEEQRRKAKGDEDPSPA